MNVELTFLKVDPDTGNIIYRGSDKNNYVSVDGKIYDMTDEGEPYCPVHNVEIKKGEPVYDPQDRFARKLEKKDKDVKVQESKINLKHLKLFENFDKNDGNIKIKKEDFDAMDFDDKKSLLQDTFPELEFGDMTENEFDEYFDIVD